MAIYLFSLLHVFSTCIQAAGGELVTDRTYHGIDLLPVIQEPQETNARKLFWSRGKNYSIRQGKWKLNILTTGSFLYNLEKDQSEKHDLSEQFPEVKAQLLKEMSQWKSTHAKALWQTGYKKKSH